MALLKILTLTAVFAFSACCLAVESNIDSVGIDAAINGESSGIRTSGARSPYIKEYNTRTKNTIKYNMRMIESRTTVDPRPSSCIGQVDWTPCTGYGQQEYTRIQNDNRFDATDMIYETQKQRSKCANKVACGHTVCISEKCVLATFPGKDVLASHISKSSNISTGKIELSETTVHITSTIVGAIAAVVSVLLAVLFGIVCISVADGTEDLSA